MAADDKDKEPLKAPKVNVDVTPSEESSPKESKELEKKIAKRVREAIEEKRDAGHKEQLDEAEREAKRAIKTVSPRKAREIDVDVSGEDPDGNRVRRGVSGKPKGDS